MKEFNIFSTAELKINILDKAHDCFTIEVSKGANLKLKARVELRAGYPVIPPLWFLKLEQAPDCATQVVMPAEFAHMMDSSEQVEALRSSKQCLSSGELVQPILEQIQDELHVHYSDYCDESLDFLLTF